MEDLRSGLEALERWHFHFLRDHNQTYFGLLEFERLFESSQSYVGHYLSKKKHGRHWQIFGFRSFKDLSRVQNPVLDTMCQKTWPALTDFWFQEFKDLFRVHNPVFGTICQKTWPALKDFWSQEFERPEDQRAWGGEPEASWGGENHAWWVGEDNEEEIKYC